MDFAAYRCQKSILTRTMRRWCDVHDFFVREQRNESLGQEFWTDKVETRALDAMGRDAKTRMSALLMNRRAVLAWENMNQTEAWRLLGWNTRQGLMEAAASAAAREFTLNLYMRCWIQCLAMDQQSRNIYSMACRHYHDVHAKIGLYKWQDQCIEARRADTLFAAAAKFGDEKFERASLLQWKASSHYTILLLPDLA
jgi:hypothetical protein